jgi:hypothetical protein
VLTGNEVARCCGMTGRNVACAMLHGLLLGVSHTMNVQSTMPPSSITRTMEAAITVRHCGTHVGLRSAKFVHSGLPASPPTKLLSRMLTSQ